MERTFIPELVGTLNREEQKEMQLFLDSPFFNRGKYREILPLLFQLILQQVSEPGKPRIDKQAIYARLFPGKPWVEGKLDKALVDLKKLLQLFLQIQGYLKDDHDFLRQLDLIKILRLRNLNTRSQGLLDKLRAEQELLTQRNAEYFLQSFLVEEEQYFHATYSNQIKDDLNIPPALSSLDAFFHFKRLDLLNHFLMQQKLTGIASPPPVIEALAMGPAPERHLSGSCSLLIADKIFELLRIKEIAPYHYQEVLDLLRQHESFIAPETLREFYTYLRNFCSFLVLNYPDSEFSNTLHHLHRDNLERGYLFGDEDQRLPRGTFLNIIVIAIKAKQFDWLQQFLDSYRFRIIGDNETHDFYRVGMANFLFAQHRYAEALDLIPPASPYADYQLFARWLELKILYETDSELLLYKLNAFKMYISRASKKFLSNALRRRYLNFANFLSQIIFSQPGDKKRISRLRQRIRQEKWVPDREWLLEKVQHL